MKIEKYIPSKHEATLRAWCEVRNLAFPEILPPRGLVVDGVAMEFYFVSDCGQLMIPHFFISNPSAPKSHRTAAVIKIINELKIIGKIHRVKWIWSATGKEKSSFNDAWRACGFKMYPCEAGGLKL